MERATSFGNGSTRSRCPFAADAELLLLDEDVSQLQLQYLDAAQTAQQHQMRDRDIAVAPQGAKELTDLGTGQRLDDAPGHLDAKYETMATR
jgi:hypothetical protein